MRENLFISSTTERLDVARALRTALDGRRLRVRLWSDPGVFPLSATPVESLEALAVEQDYAVIVLSPDDKIQSRGKRVLGPRDNLLLEAGLFAGLLGRRRVFLVCPRHAEVKIPTNLKGVNLTWYDSIRGRPGVSEAVQDIRLAIANSPTKLAMDAPLSLLLPKITLRYALVQFYDYIVQKNANLPILSCDSQITVTDRNGVILLHHPPAQGHSIRSHSGEVLTATFTYSKNRLPFDAIVRSGTRKGWLIFADVGYSMAFSNMGTRSNRRLCATYFLKRPDKIFFLECHQELAAPLASWLVKPLSDALLDHAREVEDELRQQLRRAGHGPSSPYVQC